MPTPSVELSDRKLLSVDETAAVLGLAPKTVLGLLRDEDPDRRLPAFRYGSRWCIPTHLLDGWAAAQVDNQRKAPQ